MGDRLKSSGTVTGLRMNSATPQRPPPGKRVPVPRLTRLLIGLALPLAVCFALLCSLRMCGLIRPFNVPTGGMTPAVSAGDHVLMERISYLGREPRRGDVAVFKAEGIGALPPSELYIKRVAGEPGEQLRISDGRLFINDKPVALSNSVGEIAYLPPPNLTAPPPLTDLKIPAGNYFVLGDNSTNSNDSRFWGCLPRENILGRIVFRYWPPDRIGIVK
jgi:signal peptidase I